MLHLIRNKLLFGFTFKVQTLTDAPPAFVSKDRRAHHLAIAPQTLCSTREREGYVFLSRIFLWKSCQWRSEAAILKGHESRRRGGSFSCKYYFCLILFVWSFADLLPDTNHCSRVTIFLRGGVGGASELFVTSSSICSLCRRKRITTLSEAKHTTNSRDHRQCDNVWIYWEILCHWNLFFYPAVVCCTLLPAQCVNNLQVQACEQIIDCCNLLHIWTSAEEEWMLSLLICTAFFLPILNVCKRQCFCFPFFLWE